MAADTESVLYKGDAVAPKSHRTRNILLGALGLGVTVTTILAVVFGVQTFRNISELHDTLPQLMNHGSYANHSVPLATGLAPRSSDDITIVTPPHRLTELAKEKSMCQKLWDDDSYIHDITDMDIGEVRSVLLDKYTAPANGSTIIAGWYEVWTDADELKRLNDEFVDRTVADIRETRAKDDKYAAGDIEDWLYQKQLKDVERSYDLEYVGCVKIKLPGFIMGHDFGKKFEEDRGYWAGMTGTYGITSKRNPPHIMVADLEMLQFMKSHAGFEMVKEIRSVEFFGDLDDVFSKRVPNAAAQM